jgi:7-cyano-7-deazaguanine synthase
MKSLIICSGGIDSVGMAGICKERGDEIYLMTFNYGQKGIKETEVVKKLSEKLSAKFIEIDISFLKNLYGENNQLTGEKVAIKDEYEKDVVVPLRNSIFLQIAMIYAYTEKLDNVVLGSHLNDIEEIDGERLYPDCSPEFFKTFELAMDLGTFRDDKKVRIESASILKLTKTDLIKKGKEILGDFIFKTWSCYHTQENHCGICESCQNRKKAFRNAGIEDNTNYAMEEK